MQVIDIHAHVFPDPIARKASESIGEFYGMPVSHDGTADRLLELYLEAGISRGCIHSVALTPHSIDAINRFISETAGRSPDILTGFAAIHPGREDIPGLAEDVIKLGLKGFKIHPDMQQFALDSPEAMEMFAAIEGKMPVIIHTGDPRFDYSHPRQMKKVLDAFPKLVCVCAAEDAEKLLARMRALPEGENAACIGISPPVEETVNLKSFLSDLAK